MTQQTYKIAVLNALKDCLNNRITFIEALSIIGNEVKICDIANKNIKEDILDFNPDFLLLFCLDYMNIKSNYRDDLLSFKPYVTVWDSNPLGSLYFLKNNKENHICLLMIDTKVVADLKYLGFSQAEYFPYYYAEPEVFKPLLPFKQYERDVSFAGTFYPPKWPPSIFDDTIEWTDYFKNFKDDFNAKRQKEMSYIDVFEYFLKEGMDVWSKECMALSKYLMFLQKWIERLQLFSEFHKAGLDLHIYGGLEWPNSPHSNSQFRVNSPYLHLHGFLDKHAELPKLYNSTKINLCCTQFPSACHERVFQTAACGAFILHEYKEDVPELFEPGKEIVMYKSLDELPDLIKYYLKHEDERKQIAANARKRFLSEHTPLHRAKRFMEIVGERLEMYKSTAR